MVEVYYPTNAPGLQVVEGKLDLRKLGKLGRVDEVGTLKRVALAVPYALGGEWFFSPLAKSKGFDFDLDKALEQHAAYTRILLEHGVKVSLMLQPEGASEAVYATDTLTAIGKTVLIGNPKHAAPRWKSTSSKAACASISSAGPTLRSNSVTCCSPTMAAAST